MKKDRHSWKKKPLLELSLRELKRRSHRYNAQTIQPFANCIYLSENDRSSLFVKRKMTQYVMPLNEKEHWAFHAIKIQHSKT